MLVLQARRRARGLARALSPHAGGLANAREAVLMDRRRGAERCSAALLQGRALGPQSWHLLHDHPVYPVLPAAHGVHFWACESDLVGRLAAFVAGGLAEGQQCLVVATAGHRAGMRRRLALYGLTDAVVGGEVVEVDADDLLARLVGPDGLSAALFDEALGDPVRSAATTPGGVRAFGELVGLLAQRGELGTALELERLWCALASTVPLPLLCAYRLSGTAADDELRRQAGLHHSHLAA